MKHLWRALGLLRQYWTLTAVAFVSLLISTGVNLSIPKLTESIIDGGIALERLDVVITTAVAIIIVAIAGAVFSQVLTSSAHAQGARRVKWEYYCVEKLRDGPEVLMENFAAGGLKGWELAAAADRLLSALRRRSRGDKSRANRLAHRGLVHCSIIVRRSATSQTDGERLRCSGSGHSASRPQRSVTARSSHSQRGQAAPIQRCLRFLQSLKVVVSWRPIKAAGLQAAPLESASRNRMGKGRFDRVSL